MKFQIRQATALLLELLRDRRRLCNESVGAFGAFDGGWSGDGKVVGTVEILSQAACLERLKSGCVPERWQQMVVYAHGEAKWLALFIVLPPCVLQTLAEHNWDFLISETIHKGYLDISHKNKHCQLMETVRGKKKCILA